MTLKESLKAAWKHVDRNAVAHFGASFAIVVLLSTVLPILGAAIVSLFVGLYKEYVWDKKLGRGQFDYWDLLFDWIGIFVAVVAMYIIV